MIIIVFSFLATSNINQVNSIFKVVNEHSQSVIKKEDGNNMLYINGQNRVPRILKPTATVVTKPTTVVIPDSTNNGKIAISQLPQTKPVHIQKANNGYNLKVSTPEAMTNLHFTG